MGEFTTTAAIRVHAHRDILEARVRVSLPPTCAAQRWGIARVSPSHFGFNKTTTQPLVLKMLFVCLSPVAVASDRKSLCAVFFKK